MFRGCTDIFANRWQNQQGRSGYSVACNNEWIKRNQGLSFESTNDEKFDQDVQIHQLYDTTPPHIARSEERPKISDAYRWIMENDKRTQAIVSDVIKSIRDDSRPIILTERREHAEMINSLLAESGIDSVI